MTTKHVITSTKQCMQREELGKSCGGGRRVLWDFSLWL
jgi:hypothetical protein